MNVGILPVVWGRWRPLLHWTNPSLKVFALLILRREGDEHCDDTSQAFFI